VGEGDEGLVAGCVGLIGFGRVRSPDARDRTKNERTNSNNLIVIFRLICLHFQG